jgi:hypothetical protein
MANPLPELGRTPTLVHDAGVSTYAPRRAEARLNAALADTRVVAVTGARQVGKSTLVKRALKRTRALTSRSLDQPIELNAARTDPLRFVRHEGVMVIDEVQRVPELMLAIKSVVDDDDRPGQFLLTGSARLMGLRDLPDALVGRMETIELWPFSQGEIDRTADDFVDRVFEAEPRLSGGGLEERSGYVERVALPVVPHRPVSSLEAVVEVPRRLHHRPRRRRLRLVAALELSLAPVHVGDAVHRRQGPRRRVPAVHHPLEPPQHPVLVVRYWLASTPPTSEAAPHLQGDTRSHIAIAHPDRPLPQP